MGFRFRKRIKIAPGIRLNISKSGISTSVGKPGLTVNLGKKGTRTTIGLPGTGMSYSSYSRRRVGRASNKKTQVMLPSPISFKTPKGTIVHLNAQGINTKIHVTQGGQSYAFILESFESRDSIGIIFTKTGERIDVSEDDVIAVTAYLARNARRQKASAAARAFFLICMGFIALVILILIIGSHTT